MKNRRGLVRALVPARILTVAAVAVAAALPVAATAATTQPGTTRPSTPQAALSSAALSSTALSSAALSSAALSSAALSSAALSSAAPSLAALSSAAQSSAPAAVGAITGIVLGADGTALRGACVTATGLAGTAAAAPGLTRADGRYVIGGLQPGAYTVGYADCAHPARYFGQWYGGADVAAAAARVIVGAGRPTALLPVTLRLTSPAAEVAATQRALSAQARSAQARSTRVPGAQAPGARSSSAGSGHVTGTVRNRAGQSLANICVLASTHTADAGISAFTLTGRHGGYSMNIGTSGKWQMAFIGGCGNQKNYAPQWWRHASTGKKATDLHARRGRNFPGIDAVLRPGAAISGTVRSASGRPLRGVCVEALGLGAMSEVQVQAVTRANGSYLVKNLGTGRYRIQFQPFCGLGGNFLGSSYRRAVAVTDGKTVRGINGTLRAGGLISGVVTSQATGARLADICVQVVSAPNGGGLFSGGFFEGTTGKNGTYSAGRLTPGRYTIAFSGGCGNSASYAPQFYRATDNLLGATPVTITTGQARPGIDAAMRPGGTVTGRATSQAGAGLPGVCVLLTAQPAAGGFGQSPLLLAALEGFFGSNFATTGKTGHFRMANLLPGLYSAQFVGGCGSGSARFAPRAFAPQGNHQPTWLSVNGGSVTANVSTSLRPGGTISGLVTGRSGHLLSGVCVTAVPPGQPFSAQTSDITEPETRRGAYQLTGLATGKYAVEFAPCEGQPYASQWYRGRPTEASARLVSVRDGQATTRINARLTAGGTISGRIISGISGGPVNQACVFVADPSGIPVAAGLSGKSGRFRIPNVPAGRWVLEPSLCFAGNPALAGIVRRGVLVANAATTRFAAVLPRAGRIAGTILGGTPVTAEPGVCVEATPKTGRGEPAATETGLHGGYTLPGLAPGTYRVHFTPICVIGTAALVPQWFKGQPTRATATPVAVTAGQATSGIDGALISDGGISGTVTGAADAAIAGACVGAYAGTSATPAAVAITGATGAYQLGNLTPGRYSVEFSSGCGVASYPTQWFNGAGSRAGAVPVTVTAGSVTPDIDAG